MRDCSSATWPSRCRRSYRITSVLSQPSPAPAQPPSDLPCDSWVRLVVFQYYYSAVEHPLDYQRAGERVDHGQGDTRVRGYEKARRGVRLAGWTSLGNLGGEGEKRWW